MDAATLDATPTTLQSSGDEVTLAWRDLESPSMHDWLGIYTPPASADDHYIGYILLSTCATWSTGACSLQIPMVNMRAPYNFRLFRGTDTSASGKHVPKDQEGNRLPDVSQRLAISPVVGFANYNEPTQVHLALTGKAGEMKVMFVTRDPLNGVVRYGVSKGNLRTKVGTTATTYTQIDMCDSPANSVGWRDPGYIHTALLHGLQPGKRYYYQASHLTFVLKRAFAIGKEGM